LLAEAGDTMSPRHSPALRLPRPRPLTPPGPLGTGTPARYIEGAGEGIGPERLSRRTERDTMPTRFLWALGAIVAFSFVLSRQDRKRRQSAWKGVVSGVRHKRPSITRDEDRRDDDWVVVSYRTDEGTDGKLKLTMASVRQFFGTIQVGDRLIKQQGDYLPYKPSPELVETSDAGQA